MYIKLNNTIINLDLVKEISTIYPVFHSKTESTSKLRGGHEWDLENKKDLENYQRWVKKMKEDTGEETYTISYVFDVVYLEESTRRVLAPFSKDFDALIKLEKARTALVKLLNDNQPIIHTIEI
jgi:hypothetical protein